MGLKTKGCKKLEKLHTPLAHIENTLGATTVKRKLGTQKSVLNTHDCNFIIFINI